MSDSDIKKLQKQLEELENKVSKMEVGGTLKKKRKPSTGPRKPNPFMDFGKEQREKNKVEWKGKPAPEVAKLIGKLWQEKKKEESA
tara:strand:- start:161 stop:418 length:258 start_codon:yes stop_codon:yes gene_type:complete